MPKRKELKDVAAGIAASFVSRNNDINGYWGMGILYKNADEVKTNNVQLDLCSLKSKPRAINASSAIRQYHDFLVKQLQSRGYEKENVKKAIIELEFQQPPTEQEKLLKNIWGDPFLCKVIITDDLDKEHIFKTRSCCWKHDPKRESRSARIHDL